MNEIDLTDGFVGTNKVTVTVEGESAKEVQQIILEMEDKIEELKDEVEK